MRYAKLSTLIKLFLFKSSFPGFKPSENFSDYLGSNLISLICISVEVKKAKNGPEGHRSTV